MPDDLRTRIAAVDEMHVQLTAVTNGWQCRCGAKFVDSTTALREWRLHKANALIRELGMKQEWALRSGSDGPVWAVVEEWSEWCGLETMRSDEERVSRYVTDWKADNE